MNCFTQRGTNCGSDADGSECSTLDDTCNGNGTCTRLGCITTGSEEAAVSSEDSNQGAVIGGVLGSIIALILILMIIIGILYKRRRNAQDHTRESMKDLELESSYSHIPARPDSIRLSSDTIYNPLTVQGAVAAIALRRESKRGVSLDQKFIVPYTAIRFLREIGSGSFGRVYIGEWQKTTVAIKVCVSLTEESTEDFIGEAGVMTYGL